MASATCDFFGSSYTTENDAVQALLDSAAQTCGGQVFYYSAPGGRGRRNVVFDEGAQKNDGFIFVAKNGWSLPTADGEFASAEHACVLTLALETGVAWLGQLIAAAVYTSGILEGLLLIEMMPSVRPGTVSSARTDTADPERIRALASAVEWKGPAVLVPAMRLWAASLAERLEKLRLQEEATRLKGAFSSILQILDHMLDPNARHWNFVESCASDLIPKRIFSSKSPDLQFDLWACDHDKKQLICNNSGHKDGRRVDLDKAAAGKAMASENNAILTRRTENSICIPLSQPHVIRAQAAERVVLEVITGTSTGDFEKTRTDHFDLVGAEMLQSSCFPTALWVRDRFLQLIAIERKREGIHRILTQLEDTDDVTEAMQILEHEVGNVMGCEACTLFFVDNRQGEIWAPPSESHCGICVGLDEGLVGYIATRARETSENEALITNDPHNCPLWSGFEDGGFHIRNILTAPVTSKGEHKSVLAVIQLVNKFANSDTLEDKASHYANPHGFTPSDSQLLVELANAMGDFLQRLILSVQWTKARYDNAALACCNADGPQADLDDIPSIAFEYYHQKLDDARFESRGPDKRRKATIRVLDVSDEPAAHADIEQWAIYYWDLSHDEQHGLLIQALGKCGVLDSLSLSRPHLYRFFMGVRQHYRAETDVPYHNFHHAMATLHYSFKMVQALMGMVEIPVTSIMSLLLAALCHDIDHRGRNNAFEAMTRSELALRYNDSSPLENHHCAMAFHIALKSPEEACNVFKPLSTEEYDDVRKLMVRWILATDMKFHGSHVEDMQRCLEMGCTRNLENIHITLSTILHAADISNPMHPLEIADRWSQCLCEEFTRQADAERNLGLPVTPFMANLSSPEAICKNSCGFIDFVVQPLFTPMFRAIPGLDHCEQCLQRNREASEPSNLDQTTSSRTSIPKISVSASAPPRPSCSPEELQEKMRARRSKFASIATQVKSSNKMSKVSMIQRTMSKLLMKC